MEYRGDGTVKNIITPILRFIRKNQKKYGNCKSNLFYVFTQIAYFLLDIEHFDFYFTRRAEIIV
jgi:hypothetical protein